MEGISIKLKQRSKAWDEEPSNTEEGGGAKPKTRRRVPVELINVFFKELFSINNILLKGQFHQKCVLDRTTGRLQGIN